jgi:hypothetical protein
MSNLLLAYNNRADAATLAAGSWSATLSRDNVKDGDISLVARTANAARANTRFRADLGANYVLQALALVNHNLSAAATWRVRLGTAPLDLDFTQEVMDERITFSGGVNGTRVNSAGVIVAATCPRVDYDPVTHACLGLRVEAASTNKCTNFNANPVDLTNVGFVNATNGLATLAVVDDAAELAAAGLSVICSSGKVFKLDNSLGNSLASALPAGGPGNTNTHTVSAWMRGTGTGSVRFSGSVPPSEAFPATYERRTRTATPPTTSSNLVVSVAAGSVVYFILNQLEELAFATTPIVVAGAAVTRTADSVLISGVAFTAFYSQTEGTVYVEHSVARDSADAIFPSAMAISDGTANNRLTMYTATSNDGTWASSVVGGVTQASIGTWPTMIYGAFTKAAFTYKVDDLALCIAGGTVQTDTSALVPTVSQLEIGSRGVGSNMLNGHIKRLTYWPTRLTNAQLQSITTSGPDALGFNSGFIPVKQLTFHGDTPSDWGAQYAAIAALPAAISARYATVEIDDTANAAGHLDIGRLFVGGGLQPAYNASYAGFADEREDLSTVVANPNGKRFGTARRRPRGVRFSLQYTSQAEADRIHEMQAAVGTLDEVLYVPDPADAAHSQRYGFLGHLRQLSPIEYPFVLKRSIAFELGEKL